MPEEPNRMDDLLKTFAKQRREQAGAPFELHPATRRMLQAEVARTVPRAEREPGKGGRSFDLGGWLLSGAVVAAVMVFAVILFQPQTPPSPAILGTLDGSRSFDAKAAPEMIPLYDHGSQFAYESKSRETARDGDLLGLGTDKDKLANNGGLFTDDDAGRSAPLALTRAKTREEGELTVSAGVLAPESSSAINNGIDQNGLMSYQLVTSDAAPNIYPGGSPVFNESKLSMGSGLATTNAITMATGTGQIMIGSPDLAGGQISATVDGTGGTVTLAAATSLATTAAPAAPAPTTGLAMAADETAGFAKNTMQLPEPGIVTRPAPPQGGAADASAAAPAQPPTTKTGIQNILTSFEVQVDGDLIRLVDADGSIYTGKIEQPKLQQYQPLTISRGMFSNIAALNDVAKAQDAVVSSGVTAGLSNRVQPASQAQMMRQVKQSQQQQSRGIFFRASGANRSLGQVVTFEGSYIAGTGQMQKDAIMKSDKPDEKKSVNKTAQDEDLATARILGEVQIGNGPKIQIDAVPLPMKVMKAKAQSQ